MAVAVVRDANAPPAASGKDLERGQVARKGRQPGARFALLVLTSINLLNYVDRYVPSSVKELIKKDLHLTDAQTAWPLTGMILVYMVASPIFGWVSDHELMGRRPLLTMAVLFWSAATALAALSTDLTSLICLRSLVGVGEACYVVISTPLICDFFPPKERNVAMGVFYLAIPVGAAIGYVAGGVIGDMFGWRAAFLCCGAPGLLVGFLVLLIQDPPRGINDEENEEGIARRATGRQGMARALHDYKAIFTNGHFVACLSGVTASTFALGALADWMATFLHRYRAMDLSTAGLVIGGATVVGGIAGLFLGAWSSDYWKHKGVKNAYYLLPALFTIPASILASLALNVDSATISALVFTLSEVFVWTYNAPISVMGVNCLSHDLRARGTGAQIFIQHILGDVISPPIVGAISDSTGSLLIACQMLPAFILLSGVFWLCGWWFLDELPCLASDGDSAEDRPSFFKVLIEKEAPFVIRRSSSDGSAAKREEGTELIPATTPRSTRNAAAAAAQL